MTTIKKHLKYIRYVFVHKYWVFRAGLIIGPEHPYQWLVWLWRLIIHDWTKFLPDEYFPYANYNFQDESANSPSAQAAFNLAWNHHQKRNRHHYQYYILRNDDGREFLLEMSALDRREMLADWASFSLKFGKTVKDTRDWYLKGAQQKAINPNTRTWIHHYLEISDYDFVKILAGIETPESVTTT